MRGRNNDLTFASVGRHRTRILFITKSGDSGQDSTEDGLGERNIQRILLLCSEWTDVTMIVIKVDAELVLQTQAQKVFDESNDSTRSRAEQLTDAIGE
jgi:hypothetical protein